MDGRRFASFQFREKISRLTKPKLVGWATLKPRSSHVEVDRAQEETMTTRIRIHGKRMPFDTLPETEAVDEAVSQNRISCT